MGAVAAIISEHTGRRERGHATFKRRARVTNALGWQEALQITSAKNIVGCWRAECTSWHGETLPGHKVDPSHGGDRAPQDGGRAPQNGGRAPRGGRAPPCDVQVSRSGRKRRRQGQYKTIIGGEGIRAWLAVNHEGKYTKEAHRTCREDMRDPTKRAQYERIGAEMARAAGAHRRRRKRSKEDRRVRAVIRKRLAELRRRVGHEEAKQQWNAKDARREASARAAQPWHAEWQRRHDAIREAKAAKKREEAQHRKRMQEHAAKHCWHPVLAPHRDELVPELSCASGPQSVIWQPVTVDRVAQALRSPPEGMPWEGQRSEWAGAHALLRPGAARVSKETRAEWRARQCYEAGQCVCKDDGLALYRRVVALRGALQRWINTGVIRQGRTIVKQ